MKNAWTNDGAPGGSAWKRRFELRPGAALQNLKRCPLCGTLNARLNGECVTCRWHGVFESDPFQIQEGLNEIMDRCPDFGDLATFLGTRPGTFVKVRKRPFWKRLIRAIFPQKRKQRRRALDVSV